MELRLHASLSVSIGRQPYTDEQQGSLLVRLSADAFPAAELTPLATLLVGGNRHSLALSGPKLRRGRTNVLAFPLTELPPTILLDANATVSFELASVATATPLPFVRLGQSRASQSVLDFTTGAVLTGAERVPLLPNGFDSHFSSASGAAFDERMAFDLARRGFNTIIFGACLDGIFSAQVRGCPNAAARAPAYVLVVLLFAWAHSAPSTRWPCWMLSAAMVYLASSARSGIVDPRRCQTAMLAGRRWQD